VLWLALTFAAAGQEASRTEVDVNAAGGVKAPTEYMLGAGDIFSINVTDAKEIGDQYASDFTVASDGFVTVPMVGRVHAEGMSVPQMQAAIAAGLRHYIRDPQVSITVKTLKSQPVSVLGAVNTPGVHQLYGPKRLAEVIALAGGLSKESGYRITITRGKVR